VYRLARLFHYTFIYKVNFGVFRSKHLQISHNLNLYIKHKLGMQITQTNQKSDMMLTITCKMDCIFKWGIKIKDSNNYYKSFSLMNEEY